MDDERRIGCFLGNQETAALEIVIHERDIGKSQKVMTHVAQACVISANDDIMRYSVAAICDPLCNAIQRHLRRRQPQEDQRQPIPCRTAHSEPLKMTPSRTCRLKCEARACGNEVFNTFDEEAARRNCRAVRFKRRETARDFVRVEEVLDSERCGQNSVGCRALACAIRPADDDDILHRRLPHTASRRQVGHHRIEHREA